MENECGIPVRWCVVRGFQKKGRDKERRQTLLRCMLRMNNIRGDEETEQNTSKQKRNIFNNDIDQAEREKGIQVSSIVPCHSFRQPCRRRRRCCSTCPAWLRQIESKYCRYWRNRGHRQGMSRNAWWEIVQGHGRVQPQVPNRRVGDLRH